MAQLPCVEMAHLSCLETNWSCRNVLLPCAIWDWMNKSNETLVKLEGTFKQMSAHLYSFILKVFVVHQQFNYEQLGQPRGINIYTIVWIQDGIYTWCNTNIVHINNIIWLDEIYTLFWSLFLNQGLTVILTRRWHVLTKQALWLNDTVRLWSDDYI